MMTNRVLLLFAAFLATMLLPACRLEEFESYGEETEQTAIADSLTRLVKSAYDFSQPDVVDRILALYPDSGRVVSATGGQVVASRDSLDAAIKGFWATVGQNMQDPRTEWGPMHVDVPSTRAAVVTAEYRVPHLTPDGEPHEIGGAMTLVFAKQSNRWVVIQEHLSDVPR